MFNNVHQMPGVNQPFHPSNTAVSVPLSSSFQPVYVRLPRSGTLCPFSGRSRSQIWLLVKEGRVQSHSMKRRGTCRGVRLIDFASLIEAIKNFGPAEAAEAQSIQKGGHQ